MFTFVNEGRMPPFLTKDDFYIWHQKVSDVLSMIFGSAEEAPNTLNVKFSNEERVVVYGAMSPDEIKREIGNLWNINKHVKDILSQILKVDDYYQGETPWYLAKAISFCNAGVSPEDILRKLNELFGLGEFSTLTTGEYCHATKTITLYTNSILSAAAYGSTHAEKLEVVFAHELFHAYHYQNNDAELIWRRDYTGSVVKEALASAFEYHYCDIYSIAGNRELYKTWKQHSVKIYPYSGAQYLLDEVSLRLQTTAFACVFKTSVKDLDGALRALLPVEVFYAIKNQKEMDLRQAFNKLMSKDAIGVIAHREITAIIRKPENRLLIPQLMDLTYSNTHFHATHYPIVATAPMKDAAGRKKSYADPVHRYGNREFYLTAQWDENQRELLLNWIWEHR